MDSIKSHLETLSEDSQGNVNYVSCRFKLNLTLKSKGLFTVATGIEVKPPGPDTNEAVKTWIKQDLEAQIFIGLNVSSNIAKKIANCNSAHQMLEKLHTLYGRKSDLTVEGLQRQFFGFKYDNSKSVVENCMTIQQYAEDLAAEGEEVKESWIMTRILGMLPPKLHHFRTGWDNVSGEDKNLSKLFERLRLEEDRLNEDELSSESTSQNALVSKQRNKFQKSHSKGNTSNNSTVECFKCGKKGHVKKYCKNKPCAKYLAYCKNNYACNNCNQKGHFAKNCPKGNSSENGYSKNDKSEKNDSEKSNRRALITLGLSTANVKQIKSKRDCRDSWYQDCAATQHMTSRRDWLINFIKLEEPTMVIIGDATKLEGIGLGDIELEAFDGDKWYQIILKNVLYVPKMTFNLFSVTQMLDKGYVQTADAGKSTFKTLDKKETVAIAKRDGNLYKMMFRQEESSKCLLTASIKTWHERLAHQNVKYVRDILNKNGIKYIDDWNNYVCTGCVYGKQHRISHPKNPKVAENPLDLVHVDLCDMNVKSLGGAKYFLLFKDDYSHFRTAYFLKTKDEAASKLRIYLNMVENQFGRKVKCLRSDNETEIKNADTKKLLEEIGVFHTKSNAYTPQQNGRVEREMRTVVESARSAIHAQDLNANLWAEAVNYAIFTLNQTGTSSQKNKSPAELWFGRRIDIRKLRSFGCECYVLIQDHKRVKTGKKSKKGILVGYDLDSPCYRVYLSDECIVVSSDNVMFDEKIRQEDCTEIQHFTSKGQIESSEESENFETGDSDTDNSSENTPDPSDSQNCEDSNDSSETDQNRQNRFNLRNRKNINLPARLGDYVLGYFRGGDQANTAMIGEVEDISLSDALKDKNWRKAISEEYRSLIKMNTWKLVEAPKHVIPLTCRWILRQKQDCRFKARLVARGFEQKEGIDYSETFSPVARHVSVRLIFSIAASNKMKLMIFDVKTAFLHGELKETIYMHQPEGFDDGTGRVCKLNKSIYGLKQAPKNWNEKFSKFLKSLAFDNTDDDPCIYYNKDKSMLIALFVDDGLIAGKDERDMIEILNKLNRKFEATFDTATDGQLAYLGMQIYNGQNGIFVNQSKYTEKILKRFQFDLSNSVSTPMERGMVTEEEKRANDKPLGKSEPYREAIGSLLYLATISRPDISFAVNYLSRFNSKPMVSHWKMIKRVFQYLKGTTHYGINFNGDSEQIAYTDSDYGGDTLTGHSTSGILILRGGPIVWYTQKQRLVATSTAEAEYRAAVSSIDDICWIRRIGNELGILNKIEPTELNVDNQSAIHMLQNTHEGKITKGKKHIDIPRKFIQEHIGVTVRLNHVNSSDQLADILTKPLNRKIFEQLRSKIIKEEC